MADPNDRLKEPEEEWQSNLQNWMAKRRQQMNTSLVHTSNSQHEQLSQMTSSSNPRKVKTFAEMLGDRARAGTRIKYNLDEYIANDQNDESTSTHNDYPDDSSTSLIMPSTETDAPESPFNSTNRIFNNTDSVADAPCANTTVNTTAASLYEPSIARLNLSDNLANEQSSATSTVSSVVQSSHALLPCDESLIVTKDKNTQSCPLPPSTDTSTPRAAPRKQTVTCNSTVSTANGQFSHNESRTMHVLNSSENPETPQKGYVTTQTRSQSHNVNNRPKAYVSPVTKEVRVSTPSEHQDNSRFLDQSEKKAETIHQQDEDFRSQQRKAFKEKLKAFENLSSKSPSPTPIRGSSRDSSLNISKLNITNNSIEFSRTNTSPGKIGSDVNSIKYSNNDNSFVTNHQKTDNGAHLLGTMTSKSTIDPIVDRTPIKSDPTLSVQNKSSNDDYANETKTNVDRHTTESLNDNSDTVDNVVTNSKIRDKTSPSKNNNLNNGSNNNNNNNHNKATDDNVAKTKAVTREHNTQIDNDNINNGQTDLEKKKVISVSGRKHCASCNQELGRGRAAMVIESLSMCYHMECFRCSVCHVQLSKGFRGTDVRVHANALHCQNCFSKDGLNFSRV